MIAGAVCRRCRFMRDRRFFRGSVECHRYPPVAVGSRSISGHSPSTPADDPMWFFPQVHPEDWCGEFAPEVRALTPAASTETNGGVDG